jgi:O-antigen/teichoic acid export membrane protein
VAVLSFPVFALTFGSAKPLTVMLYGDRYAESGLYLQILAVAYYFHVLLGFNTLTLAVLGRVRYILIINLIALIISVALNLYFIPRYGALGAAIATAGSLVCHNILNQVGLLRAGVNRFDKQYLSIYLAIFIATLLLFLTQLFLTDNIYILIFLIIVTSLIITRISAHKLKIEETFPELMKIPGMRLLFRS